MAANNYEDITINQGADVAIELHLAYDSGSTYSLVNKAVSAKMKRNYTDSAGDPDTITFQSAIINPAEDGIVSLSLTNTQTDALKTRGRYVYDVEISYTDSDSNTIIQRVLEGQIEVSPSVTK